MKLSILFNLKIFNFLHQRTFSEHDYRVILQIKNEKTYIKWPQKIKYYPNAKCDH